MTTQTLPATASPSAFVTAKDWMVGAATKFASEAGSLASRTWEAFKGALGWLAQMFSDGMSAAGQALSAAWTQVKDAPTNVKVLGVVAAVTAVCVGMLMGRLTRSGENVELTALQAQNTALDAKVAKLEKRISELEGAEEDEVEEKQPPGGASQPPQGKTEAGGGGGSGAPASADKPFRSRR